MAKGASSKGLRRTGKPAADPRSIRGASISMNEEMGKAFCRTFWQMMDQRKGVEQEVEQLRAELMKAEKELARLREHCRMRDNQYRFCRENHE